MSLLNFKVPGVPNGVMLQPKPSYRFRVVIQPPESLIAQTASLLNLTRAVQEIERPRIQHPRVAVNLYNSTAYYAGRHEWQPIRMILRDDVCSEALRNLVVLYYAQLDHVNQSGAQAAGSYKFDMDVATLNGRNGVDPVAELDRFQLQGCFITNLGFGQLNYTRGEDFLTLELEISFDHAIIFTNNVPVVDESSQFDTCGLSFPVEAGTFLGGGIGVAIQT